jgi:nucleoside-diphosphate-sugar epimerase
MKKRITILGFDGQIGAYLSEYLKDKGHNYEQI